MHRTITHNISQARFNETYTTEKYLRYNGASLCDLHGILAPSVPDADAVESALRHIYSVLSRQKPSVLERIGYERRLPASEMPRWHGARFSDILAKFPRAR